MTSTENRRVEYRQRLRYEIQAMRAGFSLPPLSADELRTAGESWCGVLFDEVPIDRLQEMFVKASKNAVELTRKVITHIDVLRTWRETNANEQAQERVLKSVCRNCNGTRKVNVYDPVAEINREVPCICVSDFTIAL